MLSEMSTTTGLEREEVILPSNGGPYSSDGLSDGVLNVKNGLFFEEFGGWRFGC